MRTLFRQTNPLICGCIDPSGFEPSCLTVIEGISVLVPDALFNLCALAVCRGQDVIINDIYDVEIDKICKPKGAIASGKIHEGF